MAYQTKKRTGEVRFMQNSKSTNDQILLRRARLKQSLTHFISIGDLCQSWASEIAKREGLSHV